MSDPDVETPSQHGDTDPRTGDSIGRDPTTQREAMELNSMEERTRLKEEAAEAAEADVDGG